MQKLIASVIKEALILMRDRAGLTVLFLMPALLIIIMALVQDGPFRDYQESEIPLVLLNDDKGALGNAIENGLNESRIFVIHKRIGEANATEETIKEAVMRGDYQIGIVIPNNTSEVMNERVNVKVENALADLGLGESAESSEKDEKIEIRLYIDPVTKKSFKNALVSSLYKFTSKIESQTILKTFSEHLEELGSGKTEGSFEDEEMITFTEIYASNNEEQENIAMNSVQHNVPAWAIFAMFFIVIPLAGNIIREREQGASQRLLIMPVSNFTILGGKTLLYIIVCLLQLVVMLLVGIFILPLLGLPILQLGNSFIALVVLGIAAAAAATGYGIMIGSLFTTYQQATSFGAISVIILSALGGIWVPVYVMPVTMKYVSGWSPLSWGLDAFNNLFIRNGDIGSILPDVMRLLAFSLFTIFIAVQYSHYRRRLI